VDLAGEKFWDGFWQKQHGRRFGGASHFHRCLLAEIRKYVKTGTVFCEIGCGASAWMPILDRLGADVWGIDYSAQGIAMARANLDKAGAKATLIECDVLAPGALPSGKFDVIFSAGFIEHFDNPATVLSVFRDALKADGVLITLIPNLVGWWGPLQRRVDPDLFAVHYPYDCDQLDRIHASAGVKPIEPARFFGGFGPLVVNYSRWLERLPAPAAAAMVGGVWAVQQAVALPLTMVGLENSRSYSSHVLGVYAR
jgi:SAM-dependent methyltransferase